MFDYQYALGACLILLLASVAAMGQIPLAQCRQAEQGSLSGETAHRLRRWHHACGAVIGLAVMHLFWIALGAGFAMEWVDPATLYPADRPPLTVWLLVLGLYYGVVAAYCRHQGVRLYRALAEASHPAPHASVHFPLIWLRMAVTFGAVAGLLFLSAWLVATGPPVTTG